MSSAKNNFAVAGAISAAPLNSTFSTVGLVQRTHAVCAVGYNDANRTFLCRNSWGTGWGMKGYFTIPYAYLTDTDLAADFWTIRVCH